jgi:hypothetical protein
MVKKFKAISILTVLALILAVGVGSVSAAYSGTGTVTIVQNGKLVDEPCNLTWDIGTWSVTSGYGTGWLNYQTAPNYSNILYVLTDSGITLYAKQPW